MFAAGPLAFVAMGAGMGPGACIALGLHFSPTLPLCWPDGEGVLQIRLGAGQAEGRA